MTIAKAFLAPEDFTRVDIRRRSNRGHSLLERMMNTSRITGTGCRVWTGAINHGGYGVLLLGKTRWLLHRLAWIYHKGRIPDGQVVRHKVCGNSRCFEITHLELGTQAQNVADTVAQGRHRVARGIDHVNAKLTKEMVLEIRSSNATLKSLAARFNVSVGTVSNVRTGKVWNHVDGHIRDAGHAKGEGVATSKLTADGVRDIRASQQSPLELAHRYGVTRRTIYSIQAGKYWKHV